MRQSTFRVNVLVRRPAFPLFRLMYDRPASRRQRCLLKCQASGELYEFSPTTTDWDYPWSDFLWWRMHDQRCWLRQNKPRHSGRDALTHTVIGQRRDVLNNPPPLAPTTAAPIFLGSTEVNVIPTFATSSSVRATDHRSHIDIASVTALGSG